ncbi:MAG: hypothetical protein HY854_08980 [Burkholderiales bacterium]|nr:hypothetical protein [Burkholderiales bacterium]
MNAVVRRSDAAAKSASCPEFVRRTPADLRRDFGERVKVGDDRSKIEQALIELGLPFSWDRFSGRYQAVLGTPSSDFHAVVVHVYVDERQAYKSFEAIDSFTGP